MRFYVYEGELKKKIDINSYDERRAFRNDICINSEKFNEQFGDKAFFFLEYYNKTDASVGVIVNGDINVSSKVKAFIKAIGFELDLKESHEITIVSILQKIGSSEHLDLIYDLDEVLVKFGLASLRNYRFNDGTDRVVEAIGMEEVYKNVSKLLSGPMMKEELDRIYVPRRNKAVHGFPVHYLVRTDDEEERNAAITALAQALYANKRINSLRLCQSAFGRPIDAGISVIKDIIKCSIGCMFILRFAGNIEGESNFADRSVGIIEELSELICKYSDKVQFVLCLPRECTRAKDIFFANLGSLSFIEIEESPATDDRAKEYLYNLTSHSNLRADKKLYEHLKKDYGYLAPELRELFNSWYSDKMKTTVYPQYKNSVTVKNTIRTKAPEGSAYDKLHEMIGLKRAKSIVNQALDYNKAQKIFADKGMKFERTSMHMVFTGNPGTAKTTVARLFAQIMKDNKVLSKGHMVEVGRADLVGKYVGWTAPTVKKKFEEAKGGVLFIDEAYSLVDARDGMYGDEAINTIVQEMENHRDEVVVIFAGYPDKMENFLQKNPGLRSRIAYHVPFDDYSIDELCGITELIARQKGLILAEDAKEKLRSIYDIDIRDDDFGNGRYVRNILEKAKMAQASRLVTMDYDLITMEDVKTIVASDIEMPVKKAEKMRIGFCA